MSLNDVTTKYNPNNWIQCPKCKSNGFILDRKIGPEYEIKGITSKGIDGNLNDMGYPLIKEFSCIRFVCSSCKKIYDLISATGRDIRVN